MNTINVNDTVRIKSLPTSDINSVARVMVVGTDGVLVSNMNMPFQGTFCYEAFKFSEVDKI